MHHTPVASAHRRSLLTTVFSALPRCGRLAPTCLPRFTAWTLLLVPAMPQGGQTVFVPRPQALVEFRVDDIEALLAQLPRTAAGRLLAEPDVAEAFASACDHYRKRHAADRARIDLARRLDVPIDPGLLAGGIWQLLNPAELRAIAAYAEVPTSDDEAAATAFLVSPKPGAEGRMARQFEQLAAAFATTKSLQPVAGAKIADYPAFLFSPKTDDADRVPEQFRRMQPSGVWMLHLPGMFAGGEGKPEHIGSVGKPPAPPAPGALLAIDLQRYFGLFNVMGVGLPPALTATGLDGVKQCNWRARFVGERVHEQMQLQCEGEPRGLCAALLAGNSKLPAQPLPKGALLQLRCAFDAKALVEVLTSLPTPVPIPAALAAEITAAVDGGIAIGVAAPDAGGVIPRLYLSLGIADAAAAQRLLDQLFALDASLQRKTVQLEGVDCTTMVMPGQAPAMQPTFCLRPGVLHVAESGRSLRALLAAVQSGGEAMDIGSVPVPAGEGEPLASFDLRWDEAAIYRACHDIWLPLYALFMTKSQGLDGTRPLLLRDELPGPDVASKHLGRGRGVLRRHGNNFDLDQLGTLGGPVLFGLGVTWGPIVSGWFHQNWQADALEHALGKQQLAAAFAVIERWQQQHGALPADLAELYAAGALADDALLLPGDDMAVTFQVAKAGGAPRPVQTSYHYARDGIEVTAAGNNAKALLIAIRPHGWGRPAISIDGAELQLYGDSSSLPLEQLLQKQQ